MTIASDAPIVRTAETSSPILEVLAERWSPRSYNTDIAIDEAALTSILEAARWSPSAANSQPWRFIVGRRGTATFDKILANLVGFNQAWAGKAAALIVNIAETKDADGNARPWADYDLGQASAHLSVQAHAEGLYIHQMGGIDADGLRAAFDLPENLNAVTVSALGVLDTPEALGNEVLIEREVARRERFALDEIVIVND